MSEVGVACDRGVFSYLDLKFLPRRSKFWLDHTTCLIRKTIPNIADSPARDLL